jgi:hypothetical protein
MDNQVVVLHLQCRFSRALLDGSTSYEPDFPTLFYLKLKIDVGNNGRLPEQQSEHAVNVLPFGATGVQVPQRPPL